jgi:hypothetical protein
MSNQEHLTRLRIGVPAWNDWREQHPQTVPDLSGADLHAARLGEVNLSRADLSAANLIDVDLSAANLVEARLTLADLSRAKLRDAVLFEAELGKTDLSGADLQGADLSGANLARASLVESRLCGANLAGSTLTLADFRRADLAGASLMGALLIRTDFSEANLSGCSVYGISAWELNLEGARQSDLVITREGEPAVTVDNLEVAQFIYLLLHNEKLREVINTITSKVVLILGRFTPERIVVLEAIRQELRRRGLLPVLFDFAGPTTRDLTETIATLAHMARFIIADITDAKCVPQELQRIVPDLPSVPVQPLLRAGSDEYAMFEHFKRYPWVLDVYLYEDARSLIASLGPKIIDPAEARARLLG